MLRKFHATLIGLVVLAIWLLHSGNAQAEGFSVVPSQAPFVNRDEPLEVSVGVKIEQITAIDQKSENYSAVVVLRMSWQDDALAFDAEEFGRDYRIFKPSDFLDFVDERSTVAPTFVIQNQQSNRWIHQSVVALSDDGNVGYVEKSSLTLQAPHFDFRKYPFDTQQFYFEIVSVFPEHMVRYTVRDDQSGLGDLLGEEEWILTGARLNVDTVPGLSGRDSARVVLGFEGSRHIQYYLTRMFLPMLVLVTVSWAVFFLEEYRKRAEVAGANLLVFVAFNWMISADLPRLGYLTFLDFILQLMFLVTGAIVVFNIMLSYTKSRGYGDVARRLDSYVVRWVYPLAYAAIVAYAAAQFLF